MSKDPNADPDAHGNRDLQALDCASDLFPPLRLGRMAFLAARDALERNVPQSVAHLTGGEYFPFKDANTLTRGMVTLSNDMPNYYVLSFRPESPTSGFHALNVTLKRKHQPQLRARRAYWVDGRASQ
jgi:hypothetical protein